MFNGKVKSETISLYRHWVVCILNTFTPHSHICMHFKLTVVESWKIIQYYEWMQWMVHQNKGTREKLFINLNVSIKPLFYACFYNFEIWFPFIFGHQFENIDGNTPLKMYQRTTNYDCSTPMSPTTQTSHQYSRNYRGSALFR